MPITRKVTPPANELSQNSASAYARNTGAVADIFQYQLPSARSVPSDNMMDYTWLIYGDKGIGKTTLASKMDKNGGKVLFAMFEPGGKALAIYRTPTISEWGQFKSIIAQLEQDKKGFTSIVIDPGNMAYKRCLNYVSASLGITHPGAVKDYGASWDRVNTEFQEIHSRIASLDMGFIVIAHDQEKEIERRGGQKYNKTVPVMSGSTEEFYAGVVDIIAHYEYIGDIRYLRIRGDESCEAKCRLDTRFTTPTGEAIVRIPMGRSADEAYRYLVHAFNNRQTETYANI